MMDGDATLVSDRKIIVPERKRHFICKVRDPERKGDGMMQFIAYRVITTKQGHLQGGEQEEEAVMNDGVERRFSDFVWYKEQLERVFPGCMVPALPDRSALDRLQRFENVFIHERVMGLEFFLNHVGEHYKLHKASLTTAFLTLSTEDFANYRKNVDSGALSNDDEKNGFGGGALLGEGSSSGQQQQSQQQEGGDDAATRNSRARSSSTGAEKSESGFGSWFRTTVFQVKQKFNSSKVPVKNGDDLKCDELTSYTSELGDHLKQAAESLDVLVERNRELGKSWFLLGMNTTMLGTFITKDPAQRAFGLHTNRFGNAADRVAALVGRQAEIEASQAAALLKDAFRMKRSMAEMLQRRADQDLQYQARANVLREKQVDLAKVEGVQGKEDKVVTLTQSIAKHTGLVQEQKLLLDAITESCFIEIECVKRNQAQDLSALMTKFVESQIQHSKNMTQMWEAALNQMNKAQREEEAKRQTR